MKKVLVTGGAGFVGSFLCDRLIDEGHEVIAIDNFFTGSKENLSQLSDETNFELIRHDIVEPILLEVDWIFNLACPASPIHYQYNPVKTVKTNVMGTLNMLGLAKRVKARILQASTSEVYGDPQAHPQQESYFGNVNPIGLRSCYDEGKRIAETLMMDYHRQSQVDVKIVRIFNTYGPRMHPEDGRVVSNFIVAALKGEPITIHGDGLQSRSFCYVTELVDAMYRMMNTENFTGPVNTGNPGEFTMIELAETVLKMTNSSSKLVKVEARPDDPGRRQPDITLAKEKLGWEPEIKLKEGLKPTIEYFDEILKRS
ncbi:MAG: SDR family oxidoreductase [Deltaproteobacteria bacterium]|nr:SDR family oxidoreductase [Deltaproteobacteria bacterium]MBT4014831.1 SDR family oxidoreductase [Deltaproteobacteria bacterium]MBT4184523.1 SDR family oxidoreductase [Deltaproteobacteria bacterium]MBT5486443.1 SDR family oxidoreductase [Deltaproteobacteria bacterium]